MRTTSISSTVSIVALLSLPLSLFAQDSLRPAPRDILNEITSYRETDAGVIAKGRSLLLDCVRAGDTTKGRSVLSYLEDHYRRTRYVPLWPSEELLLWFWAADFRAILNPLYLDALDNRDYQASVMPPRDLLLEDLRDALNPRRGEMRAEVLRAPLRADESEFLYILLASLLGDAKNPGSQKALNEESDDFLSRFGDSRYAPFVRRDIRFVLGESRVGWGFTLGAGGGFINGNLGELFYTGGAFDIGGDLGIRRLIGGADGIFYLRVAAGLGAKVRSPFSYNGDWPAGMKQDIVIPELSFGIPVYESNLVQVAPFGGLSGILISPPKDANGNSTSSLELNLLSWSAGLNADWKIGGADLMRAYLLVRSRLTFSTPFPQPDRRFSGNIITFTLDVGLFARSLIRDF